jgi:hypothetical protein
MSSAKAFAQSLQCRLHHRLFDRRADRQLGIDASGLHPPEELRLAGVNAPHAVEYFATPTLVFRRALAALAIDPRRFVFIDYGCGKGRVLLQAARLPFRRVEGIELSATLHDAAVANIAHAKIAAPALVHHLDATEYVLPSAPLVLYFFNPFGAPVLGQVLRRIEASLRDAPREAYAIYVNAEHARCFATTAWAPLPRSTLSCALDRLISPWPVALYRYALTG